MQATPGQWLTRRTDLRLIINVAQITLLRSFLTSGRRHHRTIPSVSAPFQHYASMRIPLSYGAEPTVPMSQLVNKRSRRCVSNSGH